MLSNTHRNIFHPSLLELRQNKQTLQLIADKYLTSGNRFLEHGGHEGLQAVDVDRRKASRGGQKFESAELHFEGLSGGAAAAEVAVVVVVVAVVQAADAVGVNLVTK